MRTDTERLDYLLAIIEAQDDDAAEKLSAAHTLGLKGRPMVDAAMGAKLVKPGEPMPELTALDLAVAELGRIRNVKGFSEEQDDEWSASELADAAACYLSPVGVMELTNLWPWDDEHWKPSPDDRKKELTKGIALALCELDRLIRAERWANIERIRESENLVCGITEAEREPSEFEIGDRVRIVKKAIGPGYIWDDRMDSTIGAIGDVIGEAETAGVQTLQYRVGFWYYLAESLEHVDG